MTVRRMRETPRVTKPYTEAQWQDDPGDGRRGGSRAGRAATCA